MSVETIITIVFAAVAAVCSAAALVVALKRRGGGGTDAHTLRAENDRLREELTREIDYARKGIAESNRQSSVAVNDLLAKYLESAEKKTNAVTESLGRAMAQLAADEKASAEKTDAALSKNLEALKSDLKTGIVEMRADLQSQLAEVRKELTVNVDRMRGEMQTQLKEVRDDNEKQLERMRVTVDEKLSETLEKRVETAFKQVSDRLESVQKGFGEMKELTASVGNLNRIFANVKTRGIWGEVALQSLFEQILTADQYRTQYHVSPRSKEAVDFAIVMPGQAGEDVYLPIDAKFPLENYYQMLDAADSGDKVALDLARKALFERVRTEARSINDKYIKVPYTTNFAILYVPNEGLYAELVRDGAFIEELNIKYRVTICGPTTVSALLNSLQMGFTTLKIQKKSGEIIRNLNAVRAQFDKFTGLIEKIRKQAQTVVNTVEDIEGRNRILTKKLDKLTDGVPSELLAEGEQQKLPEAAASIEAPSGEEE